MGNFVKDTEIPFRKYYEDGTPKILGHHSKRTGRKVGKWEEYYDNGSLKQVGLYKDDKKSGRWSFYNKNGLMRSSGIFENDRQCGEWKFFCSGILDSIGYYHNYKKLHVSIFPSSFGAEYC